MNSQRVEDAQRVADEAIDGAWGDHESRMRRLAYAQVMATLAVADATNDLRDVILTAGSRAGGL